MGRPGIILVSCGGLGMGNASRIFAVAQAMARGRPDAVIHFFTWGKGYQFLEQAIPPGSTRFRLHALAPYPWKPRSRIPGWRAFSMAVAFAGAYVRNTITLSRASRKLRPEAILLDSDYHFLAFLRRPGKLFFLGQAIDVVDRARSIGYRPGWLASLSFLVCEAGDGIVQRLVSDRVFVPSFLEKEDDGDSRRVLRVPLIVRDEFRAASGRPSTVGTLAVGSGSGIESERLDGLVAALGGTMFPAGEGRVRLTRPDDFQAAEMVVIQGGLSSISECIALRKSMVVVPIRGRAEQEVNARTVERLGLGVSCEDDDWRRVSAGRRSEPAADILVHGAEVVARHVFGEA